MARLITRGDILKHEADTGNRVVVPAPTGTKIGQPVLFPLRNQYLIALSNESEVPGEVLVQPHNCVIYLDNVAQADIDAIVVGEVDSGGGVMVDEHLTVDMLKAQGDAHGIKYIGKPYTA